jgi:aspartate/methionine/tyrosine aminotransferase
MKPSDRMLKLPASGTLSVGQNIRALRAAGQDIINLAGGQPDPPPPVSAISVDLTGPLNSLGDPAGRLELRHAIAARLQRYAGLTYVADTDLVLTIGGKYGILTALMAVADAGQCVAVFDPCWPTYQAALQVAGLQAVPLKLRSPGFRIRAEDLVNIPWREVSGIILNTPHNPTGRVFTREELDAVADVARAHDLWVISDESFDNLVYGENKHISIARLPDMRERTLVVTSFSKSFALPGLRMGSIAGPKEVIAFATRFIEQTLSCVSPILQEAALDALCVEDEWRTRARTAFEEKYSAALDILKRSKRIRASQPEGTFYLFPEIETQGLTSEDLRKHALSNGVGVIAGSAFGAAGEGHLRINLIGCLDEISNGLNRLVRAIDGW